MANVSTVSLSYTAAQIDTLLTRVYAAGSGSLLTTSSPISIGTGSINTAMVSDNAITTEKLADGAVSSSKIASLAIAEAKLANGAVSSSKIASLAVTTEKVGVAAVTALNIKDGAITASKLDVQFAQDTIDYISAQINAAIGNAINSSY